MSELLNHLPQEKQKELVRLADILGTSHGVEMVILFGSYARGNWVEDLYAEKGITYEYKSDFDILVVTTHDDLKNNHRIEEKVEQDSTGSVLTSVSLIFHSIKHLNQALRRGNYFFQDIKKEGIVLYDSGNFQLQNPKKLTAQEAQQKAQEYFDQWYKSANGFFKGFKFYTQEQEEDLNIASFQLHQAVERYYTTILLVFTDYRPKEHDLEKLDIRVRNCDHRFDVFPRATNIEKDRFELLKRAYIDARYKMDENSISHPDLEYLAEKVERLRTLTGEICRAKILEIGS